MNESNVLCARAYVLVAIAAMAIGCGASREDRLEHRVKELEGEVFDARQRVSDLKARMDYIRQRNKVLVGLVEGLTSEPDRAPVKGAHGPMASATRALEALDRDMELLGVTLRQSRADVTELRGERAELQTNLDDAIRRIEEARAREAQAQARIETFRSMLLKLRAMIDNKELELQVEKNQMVVKLPEAVLFDTGEAELKPRGRDVLAGLADVLGDIDGRDFQVAGHTDDVPIANWRYKSNWHLSAARAIHVARFLIKEGLSAERVSAVAYADTRPLVRERTEDARRSNRRIEIAVMPRLEELPDLSVLDETAREGIVAVRTDQPAGTAAAAVPIVNDAATGAPRAGERPAASVPATSAPSVAGAAGAAAVPTPAPPSEARPLPAPPLPSKGPVLVQPRELPPGYGDPEP